LIFYLNKKTFQLFSACCARRLPQHTDCTQMNSSFRLTGLDTFINLRDRPFTFYRSSAFTHNCNSRYWYNDSVRPSVTRSWYCGKTAKRIVEILLSPPDIRIIVVFCGLITLLSLHLTMLHHAPWAPWLCVRGTTCLWMRGTATEVSAPPRATAAREWPRM